MPIYTYECADCGVRFDARQKFSDDPITECPECGGYTHRVPQPVGIVFKGSGWYAKDSRSTNNLAVSGKKDNDSGAGDKSEAKADTKSESKVETKPDSKPESSVSKADSSAKNAD
jgi:putative FmdB family regulatory protein